MRVKDTKTGKEETVKQTTVNSFLVTQSKLTSKGIDCDQWFTDKEFKDRFKQL